MAEVNYLFLKALAAAAMGAQKGMELTTV